VGIKTTCCSVRNWLEMQHGKESEQTKTWSRIANPSTWPHVAALIASLTEALKAFGQPSQAESQPIQPGKETNKIRKKTRRRKKATWSDFRAGERPSRSTAHKHI